MKIQIDAVSLKIEDVTRHRNYQSVIKESFTIEESDLYKLPDLIRDAIKAWKAKNGIDTAPAVCDQTVVSP